MQIIHLQQTRTMKSKDQWYSVNSGASLHVMTRTLSQKRKSIWKTKGPFGKPIRERYRAFDQRGEGLHPGARHLRLRESWWKIPFGQCLWHDYAMIGVALTRGNPDRVPYSRMVKKTITCSPTLSFLSPRSISKMLLLVSSTTGKPLWQIQKWWKPCKPCLEPFFESLIDDDPVLVRRKPLAEKEAGREPFAGNRTSFGCNRCGERPSRWSQTGKRNVDKESERFQTKDLNCDARWVAKTTPAMCKNRPLKLADGISLLTLFGDVITMDHQSFDDEYRYYHRNAFIVQDGCSHRRYAQSHCENS